MLLRGTKPGPKSLINNMSIIFTNNFEPDNVPLNFLCIYGRQEKDGNGRNWKGEQKECLCEREKKKLVAVIAMHYFFSWGPYYIRENFRVNFFFRHMIWSPLYTLLLSYFSHVRFFHSKSMILTSRIIKI